MQETWDVGSIPGLGGSPGGSHGNPLQHSCLENPMDIGAWRAIVHRVTKRRTQLKWLSRHSQWIGICLPRQGTWVRSLIWEDSMYLGQLKPVGHSSWNLRALEPACHSYRAGVLELLKPVHPEPVLCNKRSLCNEKPMYHSEKVAHSHCN